jgi:phosphatidylserine/phosphatidylglycerophosphate/cardiolipin synthase-like enzyme
LIDEVIVPAVEAAGDTALLRLRSLPQSDTFPHLKVLSIDQQVAYIGSANLTWPALIHNVEMGVLVDGERVAVLDELFDQMLVEPAIETSD